MFYAKTSFKYRPSLYYPLKKQRKRQIGGCCCSPDAIPSFAAAANRGGHNGLLPPVMSTLPPSLPSSQLLSSVPSLPSFLRPSIPNDIAVFIPSNEFRQSLTPTSFALLSEPIASFFSVSRCDSSSEAGQLVQNTDCCSLECLFTGL